MNGNTYFDVNNFKSLVSCDDQELAEYIDLFLQQTNGQITKLPTLLSTADWENLEILAHNIHTNSNYMGLKGLSGFAKTVEYADYKDAAVQSELKSIICEMDELFNLIKPEMEREVVRLTSSS